MMRLAVLVGFLAGCAGSSPSPAAPAASGPSCDKVVEHLGHLVVDTREYREAPREKQVHIRERIELEKHRTATRCEQELDLAQRQCIVRARRLDDAARCEAGAST